MKYSHRPFSTFFIAQVPKQAFRPLNTHLCMSTDLVDII